MIDATGYIILAVYFLLLFIWMILLLSGNKKNSVILMEKYLPREQYPLRELLGVGLSILDLLHYSFESRRDLKKINQMKGAYGERWGVFYYKINMAERCAYGITFALAGLLLVPLTGELVLLAVVPVLGALGIILAMGRVTDIIRKREEDILRQFPNMVSNLALLINSGLDTLNAWTTVCGDREGILYEEMRKTITERKTQGISEIQAYINFSDRCAIPRVSKFISMMVQNINKGSGDLIDFLMYESSICWTEKKNAAKIQGEKAGNKLMIPIFMIMAGILILIMGPMASNLNI